MNVLRRKFFRRLLFFLAHLLFKYFARSLQDVLDLRNGDHRRKLREQEIAGKEQPERPDIEPDLPDRRPVIRSPATGYIIAINRQDDNYKTFEPHPDIYDDRHKEGNRDIPAHLPEPEDLRRQYVATHHQVIGPTIRTEDVDPVLKKGPVLEFIHAVPSHKKFRQIRNPHDRPREDDHLVHDFDMLERDIIFQVKHLPADQQEGLYHRKPGKDGARHEIRREDR